MLNAVRELLASGSSAPEVEKALYRRQAEGDMEGMPVPSPSTIKSIGREMARDDSPTWTLEDASPESVGLTLRVLFAVRQRSHGRIRELTRREAHLATVYLAARPGIEGGSWANRDTKAWEAFVAARSYLAQLNRGDDVAADHAALAQEAEIERGLEYLPDMPDPVVKGESR
jgi:hypothetical protein